MSGLAARTSRKSSMPSIGCILRSVMTMSTPPALTISSAAAPSLAVSTSYPFAFSSLSARQTSSGATRKSTSPS